MELLNHTALPAVLIRGIINDDTLFGSLVVRATFDVKDGVAKLAEKQIWEASHGPWDGPQGKMPSDELFYRGGVDVFLFGHARPPKGKAMKRGEVSVSVGTFRHVIAVSGKRVWQRGQGGLVASEPEPYSEIPLTLAEAFGGADEWDELPIPFPTNPAGKGFYISEQSAEGKPLPSLEDPAKPVKRWDDQPEPVGVGVPPFPYGPRVATTVTFNEKREISKIDPKFYNQSFPAMTAESVQPGMKVVVTGVSEDGPLEFSVPDLKLSVYVKLGEKKVNAALPIDQIGIEADEKRIFVTYRYPFRYIMRLEEKRSCELSMEGGRACTSS